MRLPVIIAACALVAGCSATSDQHGRPGVAISEPSLSAAAPSSRPPVSTPKAAPTTAPPAGAPVADIITWVEAGTPADPAGFHSATREGSATDLGGDIAFTTASGANCMTDKASGGALACLTHPTSPLPQPADTYGHWVAGWVDFEGPTAEVGSVHGDPGRFTKGSGPKLKDGQSLRFGDYLCRADAAGPVCVNYARRTAVRFSDAGVQTFGCLTPVLPAPDGYGQKFACTTA